MSAKAEAISRTLAVAFKSACLAELETLKPGNVHIFADGHGMTLQDFVRSAEAAAEVIVEPGLSVGQRILTAVEATWTKVGCNTNLGIILLCAPMLHAALHGQGATLREQLQGVLRNLSLDDAALVFQAIVRASPAGLGASAQHDVHAAPAVNLLEAMREAEQRDRIAWQYVHDFADVFTIGVTCYRATLARWERPAWAATAVYLSFLAAFPDTHITRKHGMEVALSVQQEGLVHVHNLLALDNPKLYQRALLDYDAELKARGINPGTSADLTVASLLAIALDDQMYMTA
jgi:triphosphoribosyl-dephospho-CoA synthase